MKPKKIIRKIRRRMRPDWVAGVVADYVARERMRKAHPALMSRLVRFLRETGARGCRWRSYLVLFEHVRKEAPLKIWEGGSGATTVLLAHALAENAAEGRPGSLVSFEEHEGYHSKFLASFPVELMPRVELIRSDVAKISVAGMTGYHYAAAEPMAVDMFFIDGPTTPKAGRNFNADLHRFLAAGLIPAAAFVDGRQGTLDAIRALHPGAVFSRVGGLTKISFP